MKLHLFAFVLALTTGAGIATAQEIPKSGPEHEKLKAMVGELTMELKKNDW